VMVPTGRNAPGMGNSTALGGVAYGNGLYVASGGPFLGIFTSPDGVTWTSRFAQPCCGGNFSEVAFGSWTTPTPGLAFVVVAENSLYSSTDGLSWGAGPAFSRPTGDYLTGVTYAGGQFVAVGFHGAGATAIGVVVTSPDGVTWTDRTSTASIAADLNAGVAYGGGKFVATGNAAYVSTDGVTWTPENAQSTDLMATIAYGAGLFVSVDGATGGTDIITSPDGIQWTKRQTSTSLGAGYGNTLAFGNGIFLAPTLATSTDGITWTSKPTPEGQMTNAVYGANGWVGVGYGTSFWAHP
jgi:hypothetical protein